MKTFVKHYIGKGKQVQGLSITKCTVKVDDLLKFAYSYEGNEFVTFEVAKMKTTDNFGRDYTVYVTTKEETEDPKKEKKAKSSNSKSGKKSVKPASVAK